MEGNKKRTYRELARYSAIGLEMGLCVAIGVAIGYFLDRHLGTSPWLILIFLLLGVVAGFRSLISLMKKIDKSQRRK